MEINDFINSIKKASGKRVHKITNSYGVRDAFKFYRKNRIKEPVYVIKEADYYKIIRTINNKLRDVLASGEEVVFPERMGKLEIRKKETFIKFRDGKLVTNMPIDWDTTLKLWYEDKDSYNKRVLIRKEEKEVYTVHYNKYQANYNNRSFFQFNSNRELKKMLKHNINNGDIDAYLLYKTNKNGKDS